MEQRASTKMSVSALNQAQLSRRKKVLPKRQQDPCQMRTWKLHFCEWIFLSQLHYPFKRNVFLRLNYNSLVESCWICEQRWLTNAQAERHEGNSTNCFDLCISKCNQEEWQNWEYRNEQHSYPLKKKNRTKCIKC